MPAIDVFWLNHSMVFLPDRHHQSATRYHKAFRLCLRSRQELKIFGWGQGKDGMIYNSTFGAKSRREQECGEWRAEHSGNSCRRKAVGLTIVSIRSAARVRSWSRCIEKDGRRRRLLVVRARSSIRATCVGSVRNSASTGPSCLDHRAGCEARSRLGSSFRHASQSTIVVGRPSVHPRAAT